MSTLFGPGADEPQRERERRKRVKVPDVLSVYHTRRMPEGGAIEFSATAEDADGKNRRSVLILWHEATDSIRVDGRIVVNADDWRAALLNATDSKRGA